MDSKAEYSALSSTLASVFMVVKPVVLCYNELQLASWQVHFLPSVRPSVRDKLEHCENGERMPMFLCGAYRKSPPDY